MNKESRDRHKLYLARLKKHMADGEERSSQECHAFIDTPDARDVPKVMNRIKLEFVTPHSQYKLHKRIKGRTAFWRLEKREAGK